MATQARIKKLERKVNILSKALDLLLFEERKRISTKAVCEMKQRLAAYMKGQKNQFVNLGDVLNAERKNKQKGSKRTQFSP